MADEVGDLVALAAGQASHGLAHAAGAGDVPAERGEHGLGVHGAEGVVEARARGVRGLRVGAQRVEDVRRGRVHVLGVEADPGLEGRVGRQEEGRRGVRYGAWGGLPEDVVRDGVPEEPGQVCGV